LIHNRVNEPKAASAPARCSTIVRCTKEKRGRLAAEDAEKSAEKRGARQESDGSIRGRIDRIEVPRFLYRTLFSACSALFSASSAAKLYALANPGVERWIRPTRAT
jgi:hypothetical protein